MVDQFNAGRNDFGALSYEQDAVTPRSGMCSRTVSQQEDIVDRHPTIEADSRAMSDT
jgi:hypothetical protein